MFQGDINIVQYEALQGLLLFELSRDNNKEYERMKYTILAGNIQLYKALFEEQENKEYEIKEIIPRSPEELEDFLKFIESPRMVTESV